MVFPERWSVDSLGWLSSRSISDYRGPGTGALSCLTVAGGNRDYSRQADYEDAASIFIRAIRVIRGLDFRPEFRAMGDLA